MISRTSLSFLFLALMPIATLFSAEAPKLTIESPGASQVVIGTRARLWVKVDRAVRHLQAVVTAAGEDGKSHPIFKIGATLPPKVDHWAPVVALAQGANTITVSDVDDATTSAHVDVNAEAVSDTREDFDATFYAGASIDSFAANEMKQYIGYTSADSGPKTGYVAGIDFAYRLAKRNPESRFPLQLWIYGETVHGQRSTEVNCQQAQGAQGSSTTPAVCSGFNAANAANAFLAVLRNSSSLEAYSGLRLEFLKLNPGAESSANLYLKSQLGFLTVQNNAAGVVDDHTKLGLGAIMTSGPFTGSYLETGWGRTDLFATHRGRRFKVDGYIQWRAAISDKLTIYPFFQLTVDSDFGPGSDDVRTYYGINLDIRELSCLFKSSGCAATGSGSAAPAAK